MLNTTKIPANHTTRSNTQEAVPRARPTASAPPGDRLRSAVAGTVNGWWFAMGCSNPGSESAGTYAAEMNESGTTTRVHVPLAAWALFEIRPIVMNTHVKQ